MQVKLTMGERLKDLRTAQKLTLEQLAAEVGISKSALGKYESDNGKDISPYSILLLADYYGVSCDYLMGRTETKNHPNTALHELHLSDASIDVLKAGKFNHRLLSELICHKDFQRFMLDAEIYVDRIADMRVNDMNAVLEAIRQMALMKNGGEENDLHLRTLEVAQIREDKYFGSLIAAVRALEHRRFAAAGDGQPALFIQRPANAAVLDRARGGGFAGNHGFFVGRAVIDRVFICFGGKCRNAQRQQHTEDKQKCCDFSEFHSLTLHDGGNRENHSCRIDVGHGFTRGNLCLVANCQRLFCTNRWERAVDKCQTASTFCRTAVDT